MAKSPNHTSLWTVIDGMQRRLEAAGLERRVVDAAVTTGIEALLEMSPPRVVPRHERRRRAIPAWLRPHMRTV